MTALALSLSFSNNFRRSIIYNVNDVNGLLARYRADTSIWQDSTRLLSATSDGDRVGAWDNMVGGSPLIQAISLNRPTLKLNVQNSHPVIRFNGSSHFLQTVFAGVADTCFIFCVARMTVIGPSDRGICNISNGLMANSGFSLYQSATAISFRSKDASGNPIISNGDAKDDRFKIYCARCQNGKIDLSINNDVVGSTSHVIPNPNVLTQLNVGCLLNNFYFLDDVGEVVIGNAFLSDSHRTDIFYLLNDYWRCF